MKNVDWAIDSFEVVKRFLTIYAQIIAKFGSWLCASTLVFFAFGWIGASAQTTVMRPQITITPENPTVNDDIQVRVQIFSPACPSVAYSRVYNPNAREVTIRFGTIISAPRGCDNTFRLTSLGDTGVPISVGNFTVTVRATDNPDFFTTTTFSIRAAQNPTITYDVPVNNPVVLAIICVGVIWFVRRRLRVRGGGTIPAILVAASSLLILTPRDSPALPTASKSEPRRIVVLQDAKADSRSADDLEAASGAEFALTATLGSPDKLQKLVLRNVDRAHIERLKKRNPYDVEVLLDSYLLLTFNDDARGKSVGSEANWAYWVIQNYSNGAAQVVLNLLAWQDALDVWRQTTTLTTAYTQLLRRTPQPSEHNGWFNTNFSTFSAAQQTTLYNTFYQSNEYKARFCPSSNLNC